MLFATLPHLRIHIEPTSKSQKPVCDHHLPLQLGTQSPSSAQTPPTASNSPRIKPDTLPWRISFLAQTGPGPQSDLLLCPLFILLQLHRSPPCSYNSPGYSAITPLLHSGLCSNAAQCISGPGFGSAGQHLPGMCKALVLTPSTTEKSAFLPTLSKGAPSTPC